MPVLPVRYKIEHDYNQKLEIGEDIIVVYKILENFVQMCGC